MHVNLQTIKQRPILIAFATIWVIEAGMNALFGYRRGGEGAVGLFYAALFLAIAYIAAWLPTQFQAIHGNSWVDWGQRLLLGLSVMFCVVVSQVAGWSVAGVTLADGQVQRQTKAGAGAVSRDELSRLRAAQAAIGHQPEPAQVEAQIAADLSTVIKATGKTVADATSNCADPSWAPVTCKRVAGLKVDLEKARAAKQLPSQIAAAVKAAGASPQLAEGAPDVDVLTAVFATSPEQVKFWFPVVLVGIIGFFANFGFAMAGAGARQDHADDWLRPPQYLPRYEPPPAPRPVQPTPSGGGGGQHFHFQFDKTGAPSVSASAAAMAKADAVDAVIVPVATPRDSTPPVSPVAPDHPVDRTGVRQLTDMLLTFKAACLHDAPGQLAAADEVYARYRAWAGGRAVAKPAFVTMFGALVSRTEFGGVDHFAGVSLRPKLAAVS
jgi:hypothetical protein